MIRIGKVSLLVLTFCALSASTSAQGPSAGLARALGQFFGALCTADPGFDLVPPESITFGQLRVTADADTSTGLTSNDGDDIRGLTVIVFHGTTNSQHTIIYEDNDESGTLTCADTIGAVM